MSERQRVTLAVFVGLIAALYDLERAIDEVIAEERHLAWEELQRTE